MLLAVVYSNYACDTLPALASAVTDRRQLCVQHYGYQEIDKVAI